MEAFSSVDWEALFRFSIPPMEIVVRGTAIYWFLFLIFRFVIRRDVGAVGIADVLLLVIVADAAQNGMSGEYQSVVDGMLLVSVLIGWNFLFDWMSFRFAWFRRLAEPRSLPLVKEGRIQYRNMRRELITEDELWSKLRQNGFESLAQVRHVYMESDGQISVIKRD
ncbi:MAG TPA: YetF domain-containing protein [Noviherbaspirillum sp.]|jgi:uncharacterized membrane protein YcaP (DUF421 family)|uniref:DUF421 domain-containing protein n=1 Tax=Noviherbaspirillum sp. TaxID=1926288 RepID=UPI002F94793B